jgi:membrane fusion protein, multidrug efflux system
MRSIIYIGAFIISLILFKVLYLDRGKVDESKPSAADPKKGKGGQTMSVQVFVAQLASFENDIFATGSVIANEDVELRPETSGRLTGLYLKEGVPVQRGQLIAKILDDDIKVQIKKNKLEQELASQIEARQQKLLDINAISKEEFDIAVTKTKTLQADLEALQVALAQTEIRAPFAGRIGLKNISIGAYVTPSTVIARVVQTSPAKIDFSVPEKYAKKVVVGKSVKCMTEGESSRFDAKIIAVEPLVDEVLRTTKIRAIAPNINGLLRPGSYVKVTTTLGAAKSIFIPSEAIIPFIGGKKIFVMEEGKAVEKTITTGLRTDQTVEVTEGLAIGDSVIVSGIMNIKNGQSVKVKNPSK